MSDKTHELNVEIGPGQTPLIGMLRDDLIGEGPAVLIDLDRESLETVEKNISMKMDITGENTFRTKMGKNRMIMVESNAGRIPLAKNSCHTMLVVNVFGRIDNRLIGTTGYTSPQQMAEEWSQKIKPGGKVIILETYTTDVTPEKYIETLMKSKGFKLEERYANEKSANIFSEKGKTHPFVKATLSGSVAGNYALVFQK